MWRNIFWACDEGPFLQIKFVTIEDKINNFRWVTKKTIVILDETFNIIIKLYLMMNLLVLNLLAKLYIIIKSNEMIIIYQDGQNLNLENIIFNLVGVYMQNYKKAMSRWMTVRHGWHAYDHLSTELHINTQMRTRASSATNLFFIPSSL